MSPDRPNLGSRGGGPVEKQEQLAVIYWSVCLITVVVDIHAACVFWRLSAKLVCDKPPVLGGTIWLRSGCL